MPFVSVVTREREITEVEQFLNRWVNTQHVGGAIRTLAMFAILLCLPVVAPVYLVCSLGVVIYAAVRNRSRPDPGSRVVVITGCDTGFGFHAALALARRGYPVVAACLKPEGTLRLAEAAKAQAPDDAALPGSLTPVVCDVTQEVDRQRLLVETEAAIAAGGAGGEPRWLHGVVNNAGVGSAGNAMDMSDEDMVRVFNVNVFAMASVSRVFVGLLRDGARQATGAPPRILNIVSQAGFLASMPGFSGYQASKWAAQALTQTMNEELAPDGIVVASINPAFHRTEIFSNSLKTMRSDLKDEGIMSQRLESGKTVACLAAQVVWDAEHVVKSVVRGVEHTVLDPVNPVGLYACLLLQPLAAVPYSLYSYLARYILQPIANAIAKDIWPEKLASAAAAGHSAKQE